MAASLNPLPAEGCSVVDAGAAAPVNILLVDDQPGRLLTYRAVLEPLGERLVEATSGTEALGRLMDEEFAVILLDVNMPGMDGFETAQMIHQHPRFEKTPIIFVTAVNVTDMDRLRGYGLGAVDYVMVPVIPEILRSKVCVFIELFRKRLELQRANADLAAANEALEQEKARELEHLNDSLRQANADLAGRNLDLQGQINERERAEARLREADRRKDEFLATLAHELRNPLAPLQNALNARRLSGADDPLQATMERQLSLLVRLIDDLLDVARISRGKLDLRPQSTTLQEVLAAAVETARPLIDAGSHALTLRMPEQAVRLHADPERLSQIFANLLNNAAKYSDPGGRIEVSAEQEDTGIRVHVRDTGIGLTREQIDGIFELFSQVDATTERTRGGLGIGLTLVRQLLDMHGGRIEARSEGLGAGSEFEVWLPPQDTAEVSHFNPKTAVPGKPCRALVVDDNRDSADTLAMMIGLIGHDVRAVYEPGKVVDAVREFEPHVVFMDVGMPGMSGHEVARALRANSNGAPLMLVAVTGWGQADDRRRTRESGFDQHLVKPPDLEAIRSICTAAAETHESVS